MKKMIITAALISLCASPALADTITKGQQATCKDANAISIDVANVANDGSGKSGQASAVSEQRSASDVRSTVY